MTDRRQFLKEGVAVSALPLAMHGLVSPAAAIPATRGPMSVRRAIFDDRYAEGSAFARELGRHHVSIQALDDGDVTSVYEKLCLLWRAAPFALAGLTQFGPMFVIERLAAERGLRLAFRIEHAALADGTLAHSIEAAAETVALAEALAREGTDWAVLAASLATRYRVGRVVEHVRRTFVTTGAAPVLVAPSSAGALESFIHYYTPHAICEGQPVPLDGPLFTWIVAPAV